VCTRARNGLTLRRLGILVYIRLCPGKPEVLPVGVWKMEVAYNPMCGEVLYIYHIFLDLVDSTVGQRNVVFSYHTDQWGGPLRIAHSTRDHRVVGHRLMYYIWFRFRLTSSLL
jgi:hypothetical protein